ncbi:IS701 family transposase [Chlorogloea sp. CCALA 695]|uniref:IS701 family transposase n=1 Tax=Chlorogloea sp. CCALA 695 TaxID=2107693 RepID=UPI001E34D43E|nr:IS701 family transposase [Chlorogloea sp. CCALA 695]
MVSQVLEVDAQSAQIFQVEVESWAAQLEEVHTRIAHRFARAEPRQRVLAYLKGLLSNCQRKNGWQMAELMGEMTPDGMQRLLSSAKWDANGVREDLQSYIVENLGDSSSAIGVLDETGFLKQGNKSVGVKRQYSGTAGRVENCQIGVFLGYATAKGFAFLDREIYLPKEWVNDQQCREAAGVPESVEFATKPQIAQMMLERARAAGVDLAWVTADTVYGNDRRLREWLEENEQAYVLAVACNEKVWSDGSTGSVQVPVKQVIAELPAETWQRLSCGQGSKGPREYDWAKIQLVSGQHRSWRRWLLARRSLSEEPQLAYFMVFAPSSTSMPEAVRVAGARWSIEMGFEITKNELGLDHYEVRSWQAWYRHVTLVLLAHAVLSVIRFQTLVTRDQKGAVTN